MYRFQKFRGSEAEWKQKKAHLSLLFKKKMIKINILKAARLDRSGGIHSMQGNKDTNEG